MLSENGHELPLLTAEMGGVGGTIKSRPEDFVVEEVPLYQPSGQGTHVYARLEKKGISTPDAVGRIARGLNIHPGQIGYAGLKDARAVTRQWISIEHVSLEQLGQLSISDISLSQFKHHSNKIKVGHLAGNRFVIRVRKPAVPMEQAGATAEEILAVLKQRGVPNYYGPQRFGMRGDSHVLGRAIICNEAQGFLDVFLGGAMASDPPVAQAAREHYDRGEYQQAHDLWPMSARGRRRALEGLMKPKATAGRAVRAVDKKPKRFFVSALQSALFNRVLAGRMPDIDKLTGGDLAYKHDSGACFGVEDVEAEQPRCEAFAISPSGPIFGYQMKFADGGAGALERRVLEEAGLSTEVFRSGPYKIKGTRRPLRFRPRNTQVSTGRDEVSEYLELEFELDSGCYATTLVQEITKIRQGPNMHRPARPVMEE